MIDMIARALVIAGVLALLGAAAMGELWRRDRKTACQPAWADTPTRLLPIVAPSPCGTERRWAARIGYPTTLYGHRPALGVPTPDARWARWDTPPGGVPALTDRGTV